MSSFYKIVKKNITAKTSKTANAHQPIAGGQNEMGSGRCNGGNWSNGLFG